MAEGGGLQDDYELAKSGKNNSTLIEEKKRAWSSKQDKLKKSLVEKDGIEVASWRNGSEPFANLQYVGGVDISFDKKQPNRACAILSILSYPDLQLQVERHVIVEMKEPYIPGFLAFREVNHLLECVDRLKNTDVHLMPQVIMVDGNGVLHPRGFGLASHLGVLTGIPTIGVGKNLHLIDGMERNDAFKQKIHCNLRCKGDNFDLIGESKRIWGKALLTSDGATNPVYISVGHKLSLDTAISLVLKCSRSRVPEPVRIADINSKVYFYKKSGGKEKIVCSPTENR